MSNPNGRATLTRLLDVLDAAVDETAAASEQRDWERGRIAMQFMVNEITPLVLALRENRKEPGVYNATLTNGLAAPCPLCEYGEEKDAYEPSERDRSRSHAIDGVVRYTCGHSVVFQNAAAGRPDTIIEINGDEHPLSTGDRYAVTRVAQQSFRATQLVVAEPTSWLIERIRIGPSSFPLNQNGAPLDLWDLLPPVMVAQDVEITARNVGHHDARLYCSLVGTRPRSRPVMSPSW